MEFEARKFDVLGIGSAIVDILCFVSEDFLAAQGIDKGVMTLVDEAAAAKIYKAMSQTTEISGGSVANSVAGLAQLGGKAAFTGLTKADDFGRIFNHDLNAAGVHYSTKAAAKGKATATSMIMVTPDAERTMATYLGACTEFSESEIDAGLIKNSKIILIEGYLWDMPKAIQGIKKAIEIAKAAGTKIAFSLSDPFCVGLHRAEFLELLDDVDILFCNEDEAKSLLEKNDVRECVKLLAGKCEVVNVTRGKHGALVASGDFVGDVPAKLLAKPVDTTGAGDLYAAGFLYGLTQGKKLADCGRLGCDAAGEIIMQLGARLIKPVKIAANG